MTTTTGNDHVAHERNDIDQAGRHGRTATSSVSVEPARNVHRTVTFAETGDMGPVGEALCLTVVTLTKSLQSTFGRRDGVLAREGSHEYPPADQIAVAARMDSSRRRHERGPDWRAREILSKHAADSALRRRGGASVCAREDRRVPAPVHRAGGDRRRRCGRHSDRI